MSLRYQEVGWTNITSGIIKDMKIESWKWTSTLVSTQGRY